MCFRRMLLSILHFRFFKAERINKILSKRPKGLLELNDKLCVFIANHADQIILIKSLCLIPIKATILGTISIFGCWLPVTEHAIFLDYSS